MKKLLAIIVLLSASLSYALTEQECRRVADEIIRFGGGRKTEHGMHGLSERQMKACMGIKQEYPKATKKAATKRAAKKADTKKSTTRKTAAKKSTKK